MIAQITALHKKVHNPPYFFGQKKCNISFFEQGVFRLGGSFCAIFKAFAAGG